jgi:hypothetical protein
MEQNRIRHTVSFTLRHPTGSAAEREFLDAARRLGEIPGVESFDVLAEVSPKNAFRFGISMEFADQAAYEAYNQHPDRPLRPRTLAERGRGLPRDRLLGDRGHVTGCAGPQDRFVAVFRPDSRRTSVAGRPGTVDEGLHASGHRTLNRRGGKHFTPLPFDPSRSAPCPRRQRHA